MFRFFEVLQVAKKKNEKLLRKRIRKDEMLSGYDLSTLNLDGCQFKGKDISDVNLSFCSIRNGSFKGCNGTGLYLSEAKIIHSLFQHVILQESVWKRCDLRENVFDSCVMYYGYKDADSRYPNSRAMRMEGKRTIVGILTTRATVLSSVALAYSFCNYLEA